VKWYGKEKVYAAGIPKLKKRVPHECAQRPGKRGPPLIFESMDRFHEGSLIYAEGPGFPEMSFFCQALLTDVVFPCPGNKGKTASWAQRGNNGCHTVLAGFAEM
jgi:hypothetical protein